MRLSLTVCGILLAIFVIFSDQAVAQRLEAAAYRSPEGIHFVSYSTLWNEQKLKELYESLLKCEHGEELSTLKQVILDPGPSEGKSGSRVGSYNADTQVIRLFEVDTTPVVRTLIHEYGHHFTYYWLQKRKVLLLDNLQSLQPGPRLDSLVAFLFDGQAVLFLMYINGILARLWLRIMYCCSAWGESVILQVGEYCEYAASRK